MVNDDSSEQNAGDMGQFLVPGSFIDCGHPLVRDYAARAAAGAATPRQRAIKLYYAVRDGIRYDPYTISFDEDHFRASACVARGYGFCITKAVLLAACFRAQGIPGRLGFGDVRNHLATERLLEFNGGDIFRFHGYAEAYLDGIWVKATPAFNIELCEKFEVKALEFDGVHDSVFHSHDKAGRRHMEYVAEHGWFDELPYERIHATFRENCPAMFADSDKAQPAGDFYREAADARQRR